MFNIQLLESDYLVFFFFAGKKERRLIVYH
jgi:hypothetical protein